MIRTLLRRFALNLGPDEPLPTRREALGIVLGLGGFLAAFMAAALFTPAPR